MAYYYSASERAFFSTEFMTVGEMPSDKVAVADDAWKALVADQSAGKIIRSASSGNPESANQTLPALTGYYVPASVSINGGASVSGALTVGGAATLKNALNVAGKSTLKAVSATDIDATGNATVGGALASNGAATLKSTLNVAGKSTLKAVSATDIDAATLDTTGNSSVGGALTVKGNATVSGGAAIGGNATVGGKNVVRSIDGVIANANGDVNLGAIAYKTLSSIQSEKGSFWFDHKSGIDVAELPENFSNADWHGFQIGTAAGNDKAQLVFNGVDVWYRSDDAALGNETWTVDSWQKITLSKDGNVVVPNLTVNGSWMAVTRPDAVKGTIPERNLFSQFHFRDGSTGALDAKGNSLGALEMAIRKSGHTDVKLYASKNVAGTDERAQFLVGWKKEGGDWVAYSTAPTTPAGATSNEVVTANFGNRQWLKLDGSNIMTGTIKSSVNGGNTFVGAANGKTIINSTMTNGAFVPLFSYEATNEGSFVLAGFKNTFQVLFVSKENKASNTNTIDWALYVDEVGNLSVPGDVTVGSALRFEESNRLGAYVQASEVEGQFNFVLAGANQATFVCSGEGGCDTEEMATFRETLKVSSEDIILAADNNVVLVANCNKRDPATAKKAVLRSNGLFVLPVHPAANSNDETAPTTKWVNDRIQSAVPTGTILPFDGTKVPSGFLVCNGAAVSRTTYADLFAVLGTRHGAGDGKATFNLPNAHRRFLEMTTSTGEVGSTVEAGLPNITGSFVSVFSGNEVSGAFSANGTGHSKNGTDWDGQKINFSAASSSGIYGKSSTVQPPSLRALAIIKT